MDKGRFSQAFFDLSIGLERLLKLIYLIDHALRSGGAFPSDGDLRKRFGHDLTALHAEALAIRLRIEDEGEQFVFAVPDPTLSARIVGVLAEFARATRYYNLDYLLGSKKPGRDPIVAWNDDVGQYLMSDYPARLRRKDEELAAEAEVLLADKVILRQETEGRDSLQSVTSSVLHGRRGEWIQRQATFHCAVLIRDLVEVLLALSDRTGPGKQPELPALHEYFGFYYNDDRFLRRRRTFLE
jgi:hypothetical protein